VETYGTGTNVTTSGLLYRYDIGLDRLRVNRYSIQANAPNPTLTLLTTAWYVFDGLGSTRALVSGAGVVSDGFGYEDAFGKPYSLTNPTSLVPLIGFFLNGQQWDGTENLYFNRARYYQPNTGRFIGQDSYVGKDYEPSTLHRYLYAANDAVNNSDPSGNETLIGMLSAFQINYTGQKTDAERGIIVKQYVNKLFKEKIFDVYLCASVNLDSKNIDFSNREQIFEERLHVFIYVGPKDELDTEPVPASKGVRYDIHLPPGEYKKAKGISTGNYQLKKGEEKHADGFLLTGLTSLYTMKKNGEGKKNREKVFYKRIATFNGAQYASWLLTGEVIALNMDEQRDAVINYLDKSTLSLMNGLQIPIWYLFDDDNPLANDQFNCVSWSLEAAALAVIYSKVK
jgi:RHS repeat-associated protein